MSERKCRTCGVTKEINDKNFYKRGGKRRGYHTKCKECVLQASKMRAKKNTEVKGNAFIILHEWVEWVAGVERSNWEGQMAIVKAISGVLGRGFCDD